MATFGADPRPSNNAAPTGVVQVGLPVASTDGTWLAPVLVVGSGLIVVLAVAVLGCALVVRPL